MGKGKEERLKKMLLGLKENIILGNYTTFKIGGRAQYFFSAKTNNDLIRAIKTAKNLKVPFFVLGGGSNLLIADEGVNGLVVKADNSRCRVKDNMIYAEAGVKLSVLLQKAKENNLSGLEWAAGIPGTVGGAIFGNAGAFGKSMKDITARVEVFDGKKKVNYDSGNCKFGYRDSIFKRRPNLIILSCFVRLEKGSKKGIIKKINECLDCKKRTQPLNFPSAGSVFQNPAKFSAGEIIEKCGLKGKTIGGAQVSKKHANFIINIGNAKSKDVEKLIQVIKQKTKAKFRVDLREEIRYF